jgi:FkbM family methyltransferase
MFRAHHIADAYGLKNLNFSHGDIIIDCGANMGDLQLFFYLIQVDIQYIAFEPSELDYLCLSKNRLFPGKIYQVALFDSNSEVDFFLDSAGANSSVIRPRYFTNVIRVRGVRLDSIVGADAVALLKIEGEGAEPEILRGASQILGQVKYICVDAGPERGVLEESTLQEVKSICQENQFEMIGNLTSYRRIFRNKNYRIKS